MKINLCNNIKKPIIAAEKLAITLRLISIYFPLFDGLFKQNIVNKTNIQLWMFNIISKQKIFLKFKNYF